VILSGAFTSDGKMTSRSGVKTRLCRYAMKKSVPFLTPPIIWRRIKRHAEARRRVYIAEMRGGGALTLTRSAQYAAITLGGIENYPETIRQHLADTAMRTLAEKWYDNYYEEQLADETEDWGVVNLDAYLTRPPGE